MSNRAMASDDLQIVSVEEVQCLCLDRRPVGKGKEAEWTSGSRRKTPTNVTGSSRKGKHRQKLSAVDLSDTPSIDLSDTPSIVIDDQNDVIVDGMPHSSRHTSSCCEPLKSVRLTSDGTDDVIVISGISQPTEQTPKAHNREGSLTGKLMTDLKATSSPSLSETAQCAQQEALDMALARQLQYEENSKLVVVSSPAATSPSSSATTSNSSSSSTVTSTSSTSSSTSSSSSAVTVSSTTSSSKARPKSHKDTHVEVKIMSSSRIVVQDKVQPPPKKLKKEHSSHLELPVYWTKSTRGREERYNLVDVDSSSQEWSNVCAPMTCARFIVTRLQRIQNPILWERLQCERQLMIRNHCKNFDVNERLLYHTSRADTRVICEEGLDQRLSRSGNFGRGIYFR